MPTTRSLLRQRWPWLTAAALVLLFYLSTFVKIRFQSPEPVTPIGTAADIEKLAEREDLNILFILVDTLRAHRMSVYGYERETTPFLEKLAGEGILFEKQLAQSSWTKCSMASLWTSLYPARSGVTRYDDVLSDNAQTPAEIFSEAGFVTAGIFRNGWVEGYFGFDQGFDVYIRPHPQIPSPTVRMENPTVKYGGTDLDALTSAQEFLRIHGNERWFLYLHLMDLHEYLYDQESAAFGSDHPDVYDNAILRTDMILEEFLSALRDKGYLDNTIVIIGSDHGEAFGERGFEGHARAVYRETTSVPLIIKLPFRLDGGVRVQQQSRNVDLWPTVLDLVGLPYPDYIDGRSQLPVVLAAARGQAEPPAATPSFAHLDQTWGMRNLDPAPTVAITDGAFRYVHSQGTQSLPEREVLFDSNSDPDELQNLKKTESEIVERLKGDLDRYLGGSPPWQDRPERLELNEMQLNQLRALGYSVP